MAIYVYIYKYGDRGSMHGTNRSAPDNSWCGCQQDSCIPCEVGLVCPCPGNNEAYW